MECKLAAFGLMVCLALAGCGSKAAAPAKDKMAGETKTLVTDFVKKAKTQPPKTAATNLTALLESLEARAKQYGGNYDALLEAAKQLQTSYQKTTPPKTIHEQLDKLSQAASSL
jgi:hypothetical protein